MKRTLLVICLLVSLLGTRGDAVDLIITGTASQQGHVIQNEGTPVPSQPFPNLNFTGAGIDCVPDIPNGRVTCNVTTAGGGVAAVGTPVDNQLAVWTSASQIEGVPALTYNAGTLAVGAAGTLGKIAVAGSTTGVVTLQPPASFTAYNWNFPATAGTTAQVLTSAGGAAAPMTWTTLAPSATTDTTNAANITSGVLPVARLADASVPYTKLQNMAGQRLLGRPETGGSGPPVELTLGTGLALAGSVLNATVVGSITSVGDCTGPACGVVGNLRHKPMVASYSGGTVTITLGNTQVADLGTMTAPFIIDNPTGVAYDREFLRIHVCSNPAVAITSWGNQFRARYGMSLPSTTTGPANCDLFGFQRDEPNNKWDMVSTTQGSTSAARRTCMIVTGSDAATAPVLVDTDIGPQRNQCFIPSAALVEEITVDSDAGTPSVIVHGRVGTTDTPLLSVALATGAAGAVACARPTAVVGYTTGLSCAATLQNPTLVAGTWLGTTSGVAGGVARRLSVAVSYLLIN